MGMGFDSNVHLQDVVMATSTGGGLDTLVEKEVHQWVLTHLSRGNRLLSRSDVSLKLIIPNLLHGLLVWLP